MEISKTSNTNKLKDLKLFYKSYLNLLLWSTFLQICYETTKLQAIFDTRYCALWIFLTLTLKGWRVLLPKLEFFDFKTLVCLKYNRYWTHSFSFLFCDLLAINPPSLHHNFGTIFFHYVEENEIAIFKRPSKNLV